LIFALMVTFLVCGLWHGAAWSFVIFGILHGLAISCEVLWKNLQRKKADNLKSEFYNIVGTIGTFCFVAFTLIFFRVNSMSDALYVVRNLFTGSWVFLKSITYGVLSHRPLEELLAPVLVDQPVRELFLAVLFLLVLEAIQLIQEKRGSIISLLSKKPAFFRWICYYLLILVILFSGVFNFTDFIYFQF